MKYIEVDKGLSIKKSEIDAVEELDNGGSRIVLKSGQTFDTGFYYSTLLNKLEHDVLIEQETNDLTDLKTFAQLPTVTERTE